MLINTLLTIAVFCALAIALYGKENNMIGLFAILGITFLMAFEALLISIERRHK